MKKDKFCKFLLIFSVQFTFVKPITDPFHCFLSQSPWILRIYEMLHFLLSWAVLALLLLVFIIHFNAFTRTCTKRSVYVDQNHQTLLSMYCLIPSQHALNAALMQIRITVSSASWSSSIKNAERHIFFQKSQFCFFSLTTLMIHCRCKTFITELIYQQNQHSFYKV